MHYLMLNSRDAVCRKSSPYHHMYVLHSQQHTSILLTHVIKILPQHYDVPPVILDRRVYPWRYLRPTDSHGLPRLQLQPQQNAMTRSTALDIVVPAVQLQFGNALPAGVASDGFPGLQTDGQLRGGRSTHWSADDAVQVGHTQG